jgi:hypothetical protein
MPPTELAPTRIRAVKTAHLDAAHVGDIVGALGTDKSRRLNKPAVL